MKTLRWPTIYKLGWRLMIMCIVCKFLYSININYSKMSFFNLICIASLLKALFMFQNCPRLCLSPFLNPFFEATIKNFNILSPKVPQSPCHSRSTIYPIIVVYHYLIVTSQIHRPHSINKVFHLSRYVLIILAYN